VTTPVIEKRFDARARYYDNPLTAMIGEHELRQVRPLIPAGSVVLDYGCGTGRTTLDLLRRGCTVTAYDISAEMLSVAQGKALRENLAAEFTLDPGCLSGRTWPVVACIGVMDYYPDPLPLLKQLLAYMATGGRLVLTFPNAASPLGWLYAIGSRLTVPVTPRTEAYVSRALQSAGLAIDALRYAFPGQPRLGHTLVLSATAITGLPR
jgi:SAM-dependent methyltransferase